MTFYGVKTFVYIILELIKKPPLPSLNIYIKITCFKQHMNLSNWWSALKTLKENILCSVLPLLFVLLVYCIIGFSSPLQKLKASYVPKTKTDRIKVGRSWLPASTYAMNRTSRVVTHCCHTMMSVKSHKICYEIFTP